MKKKINYSKIKGSTVYKNIKHKNVGQLIQGTIYKPSTYQNKFTTEQYNDIVFGEKPLFFRGGKENYRFNGISQANVYDILANIKRASIYAENELKGVTLLVSEYGKNIAKKTILSSKTTQKYGDNLANAIVCVKWGGEGLSKTKEEQKFGNYNPGLTTYGYPLDRQKLTIKFGDNKKVEGEFHTGNVNYFYGVAITVDVNKVHTKPYVHSYAAIASNLFYLEYGAGITRTHSSKYDFVNGYVKKSNEIEFGSRNDINFGKINRFNKIYKYEKEESNKYYGGDKIKGWRYLTTRYDKNPYKIRLKKKRKGGFDYLGTSINSPPVKYMRHAYYAIRQKYGEEVARRLAYIVTKYNNRRL